MKSLLREAFRVVRKSNAQVWAPPIILLLLVSGMFLFVKYAATEKSHDFGVYYRMAQDLRVGNTDLYGPHAGMDWPMIFRYPPWFAITLIPWSLPQFEVSAFLWTLLKFLMLYLTVRMARQMIRRLENPVVSPDNLGWLWVIPILIVTPSLVEEFESGNVHFFVFAATVAGLYYVPSSGLKTAGYFALGIGVKMLPAFFLPYLIFRRDCRWIVITVVFLLLMITLPAAFFGWERNAQLLLEWWKTSGFGYLSGREAVLPLDYSLHGVLTRYLSPVDYSLLPDSNYSNINLLSLEPRLLKALSVVLSLSGYAGLLFLARWMRNHAGTQSPRFDGSDTSNLEYAVLFCAMLILAPSTQRIYFSALLFPATVLASELGSPELPPRTKRIVWILTLFSLLLFAVPPLIPGASNQRLIDLYSPLYFGTLFLLISLAVLLRFRRQSHFS